jgi:hypothetical protein
VCAWHWHVNTSRQHAISPVENTSNSQVLPIVIELSPLLSPPAAAPARLLCLLGHGPPSPALHARHRSAFTCGRTVVGGLARNAQPLPFRPSRIGSPYPARTDGTPPAREVTLLMVLRPATDRCARPPVATSHQRHGGPLHRGALCTSTNCPGASPQQVITPSVVPGHAFNRRWPQ